MQDVEIIGMLKSYINKTLVGMGALKGAPCTVQDVESSEGVHTVTLEWEDTEGTKHTTAFVVKDGINGTNGVSPTVTVKTSTDSTYILTITDSEGSFDTPNLKGGGSGGASSVSDLTDVVLTDLANGDILVYNSSSGKWVNDDVLSNLATKATTLAGYGITDAYTKTETDNAITAEIEKLDVSDSAVAGSYVTAVSEADGKISVTREAADASPTEDSNKMVKSGGVYTELATKANKVTGATNGNFAGLDASGNLIDSGKKAADFATAQALADEAATRSALGAKNLLPNIASSGSYASSGTVTKNADGSLTINGTFDAVTTVNIDYLNDLSNAVFDVADLIGTDIAVTFLDTAVSGITLQVGYFNSQGTRTGLETVSTKADITFPAGAVKSATYLRIASGTYDNVTVYPMMQLASDIDSTYQPFAKTNKQLTDEQGYITAGQWASIQALYS